MILRLAIIALVAPWLTACAYIAVDEEPYFNQALYRSRAPRSLAIAPVKPPAGDPESGPDMRRALYSAFSPLAFRDVELAQVDKFLADRALKLDIPPEKLEGYRVADPELADAVMFAEVESVSRTFLLFYSQIRIDMKLVIADTRSKEYFYRNDFVISNRHFSFPTSPVQLATSALESAWHLRGDEVADSFEKAGEKAAERYLATAESSGGLSEVAAKAEIKLPRPTLGEGDIVEIALKTAPGREVSFSLGSLAGKIPMTEKKAGEYAGEYAVKKGDNAKFVFASFVIAAPGKPGEAYLYSAEDQPFAIDTTPPPPFAARSWLSAERGITLRLGPIGEDAAKDSAIAAYHVYRADGEGSRLDPLGSSERPEFTDPIAKPGRVYEYAIVAEDVAGNRGEIGPRVLVRIPDGPAIAAR